MATVFIPQQLRELTGGAAEVEVTGSTLRQVIAGLDERFPGFAARVLHQGGIAPGLAVSIDSEITTRSLLARVGEKSQVHFVPAIAGGAPAASPPRCVAPEWYQVGTPFSGDGPLDQRAPIPCADMPEVLAVLLQLG